MKPSSTEKRPKRSTKPRRKKPQPNNGPALVFGASGAQGAAVIDGLSASGYHPVYGVTRDVSGAVELSKAGTMLMKADLGDEESVERALLATRAGVIFLVTTTDFPPRSGSFKEAEDNEYAAIKSFFDTLVKVYDEDGIPRHVIFSTADNAHRICNSYKLDDDAAAGDDPIVKPLDDGSIVAHYSGKGRGGEYALHLLKHEEELDVTLLTLPLPHSNFYGFAIPLPNEKHTEWSISAAFGDSGIDMFSVKDLEHLVPAILEDKKLYRGKNLRISAERKTMEEVATLFSNIFGKDVIYNPLTVDEMAALPLPSAPAMAQMCQFLSSTPSLHDIEITEAMMFPRKPQMFKDWLLTNSDNPAFEAVGLSVEANPILSVVVFGATSEQGTSVINGLLNDKRKQYKIRATSRRISQKRVQALKALDPDRVELFQCNLDDMESCKRAAEGCDGAFLVTDFYGDAGMNEDVEEKHARNVIDACEAAHSVRHLVFSTMESVVEMNRHYDLGLPVLECDKTGRKSVVPSFDAKARAAAYARTKQLSCTFVLMPLYSESFFEMLAPEEQEDENGRKSLVMHVPEEDVQVMCMSVEELGPIVANIFDSYEVYAGHEIGLVTDFVSIKEVAETITETFYKEEDNHGNIKETKVEKKDVTIETWVEKQDTHMKDLRQIYGYLSKNDAVKRRRSMAQTLQLLPDATPFSKWMEQNRDNKSFKMKLGLR